MRECDPKKCTALRLKRLGLAKVVFNIKDLPAESLLLYPFTKRLVSSEDREVIKTHGLSAVDCSWNKIAPLKEIKRFTVRRLPFLLAVNPTNYSIPYKLSTLEALAAALYIANFNELSHLLLSKVKWGNAFLTLNREPLTQYASASSPEEVAAIDVEYRRLYKL